MSSLLSSPFHRLSSTLVQIPIGFVPGMRVPAFFYADPALEQFCLTELNQSQKQSQSQHSSSGFGGFLPAVHQLSNVAALPGIVKGSFGMPDIHSGYGFAIGNVAAFDTELPEAVVAPGGIGFDISCVAENSLISTSTGLSVPIQRLNGTAAEADQGQQQQQPYTDALGWNSAGRSLSAGLIRHQWNSGMKSCVRLTLNDGRQLVVTADHRVLVHNSLVGSDSDSGSFEFVEFRHLNYSAAHNRLVCGPEFPEDTRAESDEFPASNQRRCWNLIAGELKFDFSSEFEREKSLAFARILGAGNSIETMRTALSEQKEYSPSLLSIAVGHPMDANSILADLDRLNCNQVKWDSPTPKFNSAEQNWLIQLPSALANSIRCCCSLNNSSNSSIPIPSFLSDADCPPAFVREFLGGLMGSHGISPWIDSDSLELKQDYLLAAVVEESDQWERRKFEILQNLMAKCGIQTKISEQFNENSKCIFIALSLHSDSDSVSVSVRGRMEFLLRLGFRFSAGKQFRQSAAQSYWRISEINQRENQPIPSITQYLDEISEGEGDDLLSYFEVGKFSQFRCCLCKSNIENQKNQIIKQPNNRIRNRKEEFNEIQPQQQQNHHQQQHRNSLFIHENCLEFSYSDCEESNDSVESNSNSNSNSEFQSESASASNLDLSPKLTRCDLLSIHRDLLNSIRNEFSRHRNLRKFASAASQAERRAAELENNYFNSTRIRFIPSAAKQARKFNGFAMDRNSFPPLFIGIKAVETIEQPLQCFDLTVRGTQSFMANAVTLHNCGVRLIRTNLFESDIRPVQELLAQSLFDHIPVGVGSKGIIPTRPQDLNEILEMGIDWSIREGFAWAEDKEKCEENGRMLNANPSKVSDRAKKRGLPQLATLGAGNHYAEIQIVDEIYDRFAASQFGLADRGRVCIMIHCGSRGLGHQVATDSLVEMETAMARENIFVNDKQLACARIASPEGQNYLEAMAAAANFAWVNRSAMTFLVRQAFAKVFESTPDDLQMELIYDVSHNIAKFEDHLVDGRLKRLLVHRKGSTRAFGPNHPLIPADYQSVGQPVLIGGSMGTSSYVLTGTEIAMESTFGSTCHGAGRSQSRNKSRKTLDYEQVLAELSSQNISIRVASPKLIMEEAPDSYKDVSQVVEICHNAGISKKCVKLRPVAVIKG